MKVSFTHIDPSSHKQFPDPRVVKMMLLSTLQEALTSEPFLVSIAPAVPVGANTTFSVPSSNFLLPV
jgi:hypothetical protein